MGNTYLRKGKIWADLVFTCVGFYCSFMLLMMRMTGSVVERAAGKSTISGAYNKMSDAKTQKVDDYATGKSLLLVAIVTSTLLLGCKQVPKRPEKVPASAVWAGGVDGGAFIYCIPSHSGEPNPCTVYNDGTGNVYRSGKFVVQGQTRGAKTDELKYDGAPDGTRIFLKHNVTLVPLPPERPASVPKAALLAENGVYADCHASSSNLYQCSLYLAANGDKLFSGSYRCEESGPSSPCTQLVPGDADRDEIGLENGSALKLVK